CENHVFDFVVGFVHWHFDTIFDESESVRRTFSMNLSCSACAAAAAGFGTRDAWKTLIALVWRGPRQAWRRRAGDAADGSVETRKRAKARPGPSPRRSAPCCHKTPVRIAAPSGRRITYPEITPSRREVIHVNATQDRERRLRSPDAS